MKLDRIHLGFDWCKDYSYVKETIIREHEKYKYPPSEHNFRIRDWDCIKLLLPLYHIFYEQIIADFTYPDYSDNTVAKFHFYAYVMNNKRWEEKYMPKLWHDHTKSSCAANGVFYFHTPTCPKSCPDDGALLVKESWDHPEVMIHPEAGELITMPGTYPHCPIGVETDEYRIAINIEAERYWL